MQVFQEEFKFNFIFINQMKMLFQVYILPRTLFYVL